MSKKLLYWDFVLHEAALIRTDGCSHVTGAFSRQCRAHDLAYYYARDPGDAYRRYLTESAAYWREARPVTQAEADAAFRRWMQSESVAGWYSPVAALRWLGLRIAGRAAWERHRAREATAGG